MPSITPFLWFNGKAEQAAKFYTSIFKSSKIVSTMRDGKKYMSVTFRIDGLELVAFNGGPHFKLTPAISLFVSCKTQKEVDYYWEKLSKGGKKVQCGWLTDRFGVSWQIVPEILGELLEGKDKKGAERAWKAMMEMTKFDIAELKRAYAGK